jgi:transcriptional regulator of acetoin/glycerol metabolism
VALLLHAWPYNVREVEKLAAQLRLLAGAGGLLDLDPVAERLPAEPPADPAAEADEEPYAPPQPPRPPAPTAEELVELLRRTRGNVSALARLMGRSRRQVDRWLAEHRLAAAAYREPG